MGLKGGDRGPFPVVPPTRGASDGSTGPRLDRSSRPDRLGTKSPLRGCRPPPPDWRAFLWVLSVSNPLIVSPLVES